MGLSAASAVAALCFALCVGITTVGGIRVTLISDIHYDPLYGTEKAKGCTDASYSVWGMPGCDSSPQLTARALEDVSAQNTSLLLYGGDWQRHSFLESGLKPDAIFKDLSRRFRNVTVDGSLGEVAFCASLGNNDVVPDYYYSWENETSVQQLTYRVDAMRDAGLLSDAEASVMVKCGYYTHEMANVHVIVLHTLLWAHSLRPPLASSVRDPCNQLSFLRNELVKARRDRKRAIIMGHIPPGIDLYAVLKRGFKSEEDDMFWKEEYVTAYDSIVSEFKDLIVVQLFGHTHHFRLLTMPRSGALALIIPAISPIFGNNPYYMVASFSNAWSLEDVLIRYATGDGVFHSGISAKFMLNLTVGLHSVADVRAAIALLATDDVMFERFITAFCGGEKRLQVFPKSECDNQCRHTLVCSMLENNYSTIQRCVAEFGDLPGPSRGTRLSGGMIAVIVLLSLLVIGAIVVLLLWSRRRRTALFWPNVGCSTWWNFFHWNQENTTVRLENIEMEVPPCRS
ncbi:conserved hypothetical protein [Leishmania braziliensis MHOM/BR/75/M2904]|uniref:Calcineurin-like phosphoesterase domain-containing protein n=2 Tax=Leishmania braziliensis TaxID=5660 RepID=A4HB81_LEIBR|nr:conserved hypothetical protein [Leishmania braziliensis MHOM/BR/75/M2904]CAJ2471637.1 unnamed protein product [Leishmania braziliensis]CAM38667.1 conserved hypothetical protein [Leishmania braziliensis MHOM/BR/75/M2904]SYZ65369.1 hypothetical_protein [Leishmania braziliensis MHOM/BR/75/M2904]